MAVVHFLKLFAVVMECIAVRMDTLVMLPIVLAADTLLLVACPSGRYQQVLFALMANLSVQMATHVINFLQDNGVVVPFRMLSAVVIENIAVQMGTPAMFHLEHVVKEANAYLSYKSYHMLVADVVYFLGGSGIVVPDQVSSVAMDSIAVLMDTPAMFHRTLVAQVNLRFRR